MPHPPLPLQLEDKHPSASASAPFRGRPKTAKTHLAEELKELLLTEIERVVADARAEFRHHHELFDKQARLTETLLNRMLQKQVGPQEVQLVSDFSALKATALDNGDKSDGKLIQPAWLLDAENRSVGSKASPKPTRSSDQVTPSFKANKAGDRIARKSRETLFAQTDNQGAQDMCVLEYHVEDFYYDTGLTQAIARSDIFSNITLSVVLVNAIYLGVDADRNHADTISEAHPVFQVCEYSFFCFFLFEWLVRFCAFRSKLDCLKDTWFNFDSVLVAMMVIENTFLPVVMSGAGIPIPTSLIKLVRLARLARMARLMRALPELTAMIKGLRKAMRAVGSALLLLLILVYVFSVIVFVLLRESVDSMIDSKLSYPDFPYGVEQFGTLSLTMWTLLVDGAFMDGYATLSRRLIEDKYWIVFSIIFVYTLASALTVINMLIGVLCEVVTDVAKRETEEYSVAMVKETLLVMLLELDSDGSGAINKEEVKSVVQVAEAVQVLENIKVGPRLLLDHVDYMLDISGREELMISEVMDLIFMLRGDRTPSMKEMQHALNFQTWRVKKCVSDANHVRRVVSDVDFVLPNHLQMAPGPSTAPKGLTADELAAMRSIFDEFDLDKSETIDAEEFGHFMKKLGAPMTEEEAKDAIDSIRAKGRQSAVQGALSFNDFMRWWKQDHDPDRQTQKQKDARHLAKFKFARSRLQNPNVAKISITMENAPDTLEWRIFFEARGDDGTHYRISPWHEIPLKNEDGTYNFVCEIPKWTRKKNEISTGELYNPIKQDTKNGKLRNYNHGDMVVNYGAFPQTWEDPNHVTKDTGYKGDNDPLDVMEVGMREREVGSITAVKVLGVIAMIDDGETDWKVLVLARDDPNYDNIDDLQDLEAYMPNAVMRLTEWLRNYKVIDGKPQNKFGFEGKPQDKNYAIDVIEETHEFWKKLVDEKGSMAIVD